MRAFGLTLRGDENSLTCNVAPPIVERSLWQEPIFQRLKQQGTLEEERRGDIEVFHRAIAEPFLL